MSEAPCQLAIILEFHEVIATNNNFMVQFCTTPFLYCSLQFVKHCIFHIAEKITFAYKQFKLALYFVDNISITIVILIAYVILCYEKD